MAVLRRRKPVLAAVVALLVQLAAAKPGGAGEGLEMMEQNIKAGLLYNFLKYTEWPQQDAARAAAATVCIFGEDPFRGALEPMTERTVNQRRIAVRRLDRIQDTEACDLLFVNAGEGRRWPELSRFLAGKSVLTVSDLRDFAVSGGMIEFGKKNHRIDVKINMKAVTSAKLQVQERLLNLGHVVEMASP